MGLTEQINAEFNEFIKKYKGKKFMTSFFNENEPFSTSAKLKSKTYTEQVLERGLDINDFNDCVLNSLRPGVVFRLEVYQIPGDNDKFLSARFEANGGNYSFIAHILTNDPEYVANHQTFKWQEVSE